MLRNGLLGIGWGTTILLAVLVGVDWTYNHGEASRGIASLFAGLIPHHTVTVGK
jgi:hypothetical protein